jgi:O-antigen/teichoic acid export membrane protein
MIRALFSGKRFAYASGEFSNALTLALFAILARLLGVEPYGEFVTIIAVSAILSTGVEFGFHTLLTRTIAREPERAARELGTAHRRQVLLAPVLLLAMYGYLCLTTISPAGRTAGLLIGASVIVRALKETMRGVSRGLNRFGLEATFLWTERAALLLACVVAVQLGGGIVAVGAAFLIVRLLDFLVFLVVLRRRIGPAPAGSTTPIMATWTAALPFAVSNLLWSMYAQIDPALLTALATAHDAGIYGGIYRFIDLVQVVPRLLIVVTFPAMAVAWLQDRERFHLDLAALRDTLMLVGLPVLFLPTLLAGWALSHTVGPDYAVGARSLQVLMVGNFFAFQSLMLWQALQAAGQERQLVWVLGLTVGLKVVLNLLFASRWGHFGTAGASAMTELGYFLLLAGLLRRADPQRAHPIGLGEMVGASVLAGSALLIGSGHPVWGGLAFATVWVGLAIRLGPKVVADLQRV